MIDELYSDFLFARPSFLEGIARIVDFGNTLQEYNQFSTPEQADTLALRADWIAVGNDFWSVFEQIEAESPREMCI